jgi:NAD(P)-dependent dehydrogenase (short-subunit alcohol dehydrogenase family)
MQLENKVAVVTGAAQGNGRAIAERLAAEGALVVCGDIKDVELEAAVKGIIDAGGRAEALHCDVSRPDDVEALVAVAERQGGPHAVVAQAGGRFGGSIEDTTFETWNRVMAVDLGGTFLAVRAAIPRMRKLGGGSIVTMSGTFAWYAEPDVSADCAAKGAILSFTRAVAVECGQYGIRCNAIAPGYITTPMVTDYLEESGVEADKLAVQVSAWHALGRMGRADEIAAAALFLCSDESSFVSGHVITVDGGLSAGINARQVLLGR